MKYWVFKDKVISLEYFTNAQLHREYKRIDINFASCDAISIEYSKKEDAEKCFIEFVTTILKSDNNDT